MAQKIIDVVGISKESFAKAAENAVLEAAKTVHGMKWARTSEFEMELNDKKVLTRKSSPTARPCVFTSTWNTSLAERYPPSALSQERLQLTSRGDMRHLQVCG